MLKLVIIGLIGLSSFLYANINVVVSIVPQQTFVEKIGGTKVNVTTMVKPGSDPHTYELKPSQMVDLSKADIYFSIKVQFENVWLKKFAQHNQAMQFSDMTKGIAFIELPAIHSLHHNHHHHYGRVDPHTWTAPSNVKIMAKNIYDTLVEIDGENRAYYTINYKNFLKEIEQTDNKIKKIFASLPKGSKFMVFHPSWGYFAKEYGLIQLAIEVEGKEPKPKMLKKIIEESRKQNIKAIFTQQEFSDKSAKAIASELHIKVLKETPLAKEWSDNLIKKANAIANNH
jgi:zinc transport system substrate-binding protein